MSFAISAITDKRKLSYPKKVIRASKVIDTPQKLKDTKEPESDPEEQVIGPDSNDKEVSSNDAKTLKPGQLAMPFKSKAYRRASYAINSGILP